MKTLLYKNLSINYSDSGEGSVVVLLHGYLENLNMWHFLDEFRTKFRIIAIDLLGHGKSDCLGYIHTMENQASMVNAVLEDLKIEKLSIIGHSMGGYVGLAFAELYPKKIKTLVLMNSTAFEDSDERKKNRDRAIKMVKKDYETFVRISISNLFGSENRHLIINEIENTKIEALKTPLQGIISALEGMKIRKNRTAILQLPIPILFILSKKDPVLNYDENILQIKYTNVVLATLPDGHMSHIENTQELLSVLNDYSENF